MKIALALGAATALVAGALVAPAATAAPAPAPALVKKTFTVFGKFDTRQTVPYGNAKGIGNLTITQGTVTDESGNKAGTLTTVIRVVAPSPKPDAELRDTQSSVTLKDGTIFAQAVNEDPKGGPPKTLTIMPVTGGTGAYASARGTLIMYPQDGKYRMAYDLFVDKDLKSTTLTFGSVQRSEATGTGAQGIGDVMLSYGVGADDSYIAVATRAGLSSGVVTSSVDLQVFTSTGSLFARAITRAKAGDSKDQAYAVMGGTGSYSGYRGELTMKSTGRSMTVRLAAPTGESKPLTWVEVDGAATTVAITGGSLVAAKGAMYEKADKKKQVGDLFFSQTTYDAIGGVTPIATMIEQDFKTGTMLVTGITLSTGAGGPAVLRPIVGGTGDYGGAAGQVSSIRDASGMWRKAARFWRWPPAGEPRSPLRIASIVQSEESRDPSRRGCHAQAGDPRPPGPRCLGGPRPPRNLGCERCAAGQAL